jgi:hypothetical protein
MSRDVASPPSPFAPSTSNVVTGSLDDPFEAMLLDPHDVSPDNFTDKWVAANTKEALTLSSVDDARLKECIVAALALVWGVPMMCPMQLEACYCLLHPHCPNALVVVDQTGGGKTHILWTLGVIKHGIVLIFIPLLTLSANVMHKFEKAIFTWGNMGVYHLDEIYDCNCPAFFKLLHHCSSINRSTSSTLFIFLTLQFLMNRQNALDVSVTCAQERTLCLIAMDEAHIQVQHGTSFRNDICALALNFLGGYLAINQPINVCS